MQIRTLIATIAVLILIGLGVWGFSKQPANHTQTPGASDGTLAGYNNQTTVSNTSAAEPVDLSKQYSLLFASLSAKRIVFTGIDSVAGDLGPIYELYKNDISYSQRVVPNLDSYPMHASLEYLNDDDLPEIVVYEDLPGFCGTAGCPIEIYIADKEGTKWTQILSTLGSDAIGLANSRTAGYADLYITNTTDNEGKSQVQKYLWDGDKYVSVGAVATWDGSEFVK